MWVMLLFVMLASAGFCCLLSKLSTPFLASLTLLLAATGVLFSAFFPIVVDFKSLRGLGTTFGAIGAVPGLAENLKGAPEELVAPKFKFNLAVVRMVGANFPGVLFSLFFAAGVLPGVFLSFILFIKSLWSLVSAFALSNCLVTVSVKDSIFSICFL